MTNKELSRYLKPHEITINKYAAAGIIPAIRIGRVWRFDKDLIDSWIRTGQNKTKTNGKSKKKYQGRIWEAKATEVKSVHSFG